MEYMPNQIFELFGHRLDDRSVEAEADRKAARCPFMDGPCDGGGNRHQTTIQLSSRGDTDALRTYFDVGSVPDKIVPGICSIHSENETWIVCPRRLFGFRFDGHAILPHELSAIQGMNLPRGIELGIWAEVTLNWTQTQEEAVLDQDENIEIGEDDGKDGGGAFEYHFDYVIAPLYSTLASDLFVQTGIKVNDIRKLVKSPKSRRTVPPKPRGRKAIDDFIISQIPDLKTFAIIEVMTASTSGSNKDKGTTISQVFEKAILGQSHESPGINKRQVWGRMATQLFAKSAAAEAWGGKTYWLLQDQFLSEIERSTQASIVRIDNASKRDHAEDIVQDAINLAIFEINRATGATVYKKLISGYSGINYRDQNNTFIGILLPNLIPPRVELLRALLRKAPVATITIPELELEVAAL